MDHPWWTYGAGYEHNNGYTHSYSYTNSSNAQFEQHFCNYCCNNHCYGQCPQFFTSDFKKDDYSRVHGAFQENSFHPSYSHEHSFPYNPNYLPPTYASQFEIPTNQFEESLPIGEKSSIEKMLERILENQNKEILEHQHSSKRARDMLFSSESLRERSVIEDPIDSRIDIIVSSENVILGTEDLPVHNCKSLVGNCEFGVEEGENEEELGDEIEIPTLSIQTPHISCEAPTYGSSVDFIGFSRYFRAPEVNLGANALKGQFLRTSLKSSWNEIPSKSSRKRGPRPLAPCQIKRNEDKVVYVFDTYD